MAALVVATLPLTEPQLALVSRELAPLAEVVHLPALDDAAREHALRSAAALLSRNTAKELRPGEASLIRQAKLIQYVNAGIDFVPLHEFAPHIPIAANGGAYAPQIAEHAMALYLAAAKRLFVEHAAMQRGEFNFAERNRALAGAVCGILGFGGIGTAIARLARAFGMRVHAINRRGASSEPVDWIGPPDRLDEMLAAADVLMICAPLSRHTRGLIGAVRLARMKPDAVLVNVSRGEIVEEDALYAHLLSYPGFIACIDAWWVEPMRHGAFRLRHPFLDLPNVVASPHNSATVPGGLEAALRSAVANIRRALEGRPPLHRIAEEERTRRAGGAS
ncbi:MAG: 2-hydroxyacid dehydrogenase [Lautropia sp.]